MEKKQEKEFIIDYNEIKLLMKFSFDSNSMKVSIRDNNNVQNFNYENTFNKENLDNIYKGFRACETIEEVFKHFIILVEKKKYTLKKISDNELYLVFKVFLFFEETEFFLNLYKKN